MTADAESSSTPRIAATRAFFAPRAAGWEQRFPNDDARYAEAVAELAAPVGGAVLDAACGTGRALPPLRAAVGPNAPVLGVDVTIEMLRQAARLGRDRLASLILADVTALPLATQSLDAIFAAGLISHLPDPFAGLVELARVCRDGGRLALFHPIGRRALARRHGGDLDPGDIRAGAAIRTLLASAGWRCENVDDAEERYLVLAVRQPAVGLGRLNA